MKNSNFFCVLICILTFNINFSQNNSDYIHTTKNDTIFCSIQKIEKDEIYYKNSTSTNNNLSQISFDEVINYHSVKDVSSENKYNRTLKTPSKGKALVYIYRTHDISNSLVGFKIKYKNELLVNLKNNSFFVHEVNPGSHLYSTSAWLSSYGDININAKEDKVYFIQVDHQGGYHIGQSTTINIGGGPNNYSTVDFTVFQRSSKMGEIMWKTIKKEL